MDSLLGKPGDTKKVEVMRIGSPGHAARIDERNPGKFADIRVKLEALDNKYYVP